MAKKQLNTSGVDMSVFQKKDLNTDGVDMSVFDVKKKESGGEVSEPSEEPFSLDTSVDLTQYQEPAKKSVPDERELFLSAFEGEEKEIASKAFDATNKYFSGMGGMTPTQKMRELDSRLKAVQSQYQTEDIASLSEEELEKLEQDYTDVVEATASELGLRISEDGKITPYEEELQQFKQKLEDNIRLAEKDSKKEAGFFENLYLKLGAGYERAASNVLDIVGVATGLNYFESYKSLSEGNKYTAEQLSSLANRYDDTIENYLVNGEIGKAAGAAVSGAVESLPGMLPIFINPQYGLYVMSGMSGIDKYREIEESSIPEWEKYYNAFITGASEYAGEKLVTIPILARSKKAILSLGEKRGKQAIENAVKKSVEHNASKLGRMPEWVSEGLSEVATGISTDIVDKVTINPDIEIGGQAVDNFAVGAVMGKIFALPQDVAVARNRLAAREFSRKVIDKLPADMSIDAKISLGWKIAERDALQQAEDKLDEGFKGKYQERIDRLNGEIDAVAADYLGVPVEEVTTEFVKPEVGKVEPVGEMQQKLDYLIERGVEVPDVSKEADVDKLYRQERVKAIKEGNAELDGQIAEAQTRLGLETTPDVEISDDTELTLEQLDNGEPVTNEFLKKASDELYEKYNELEAMKQSDSRVYTTEQIESMQEFLGEEITKLEDYAKEQAETGKFVGETETGEVTERGTEEVVEVKPKIKEDGKEMQEREGAQQGVQKPEDEVTERGKETAEASKKADEEAVVPVTSFKKGDGGTKGTFKDKSGKIYKSLVPQRAVFKDGKAVREPIEGATTDEHSILSELQDRSYVPKVGGVVETSEGSAFEIEELSEVDKLSRDEYLQLRANIEQLNSDGYQIGDMVSVMRRPDTGEVVITDFSTAQKGVKDANDVDLLSGVEEKLSPKDRAWVDTRSKAVNARKVAELVGERSEGNKYLLTQRPPSIGTHPIEGLVGDPVEKQMDGRTVYELSYEKPLSDAEVQRFELSPVLSPSDYVGMVVSGVTPGIDFYVKNVKDRTVTLEAVAQNGKTITNNMRTAEFVRKINNNELSLSEPSLKPTTAPQKPSDRVSPEKGVTTPPAEKVAEKGITEVDTINRDYKKLKEKFGERKTKKYFEQVDRLFNPIENEIVEYRPSGVVVKNGDKYEFHALIDMDLKTWRVAAWKPIDVTDQFVKVEKVSEKGEKQDYELTNDEYQKAVERANTVYPSAQRISQRIFNWSGTSGLYQKYIVEQLGRKPTKQGRNSVFEDVSIPDVEDYMQFLLDNNADFFTKKNYATYKEYKILYDRGIMPGWTNHKTRVEVAIAEGKKVPKDVLAEYPDLAAEYESQQKGAKRKESKVAETAPTQAEAAKVEQGAGIKPKNVRDVYKAGREVFGLNRAQALAQAVVVDRIIGKIAKRRGVNKSKVYSEIEFRKSTLEDLSKESRNLYQAVWHGSPYAFEKFRLDKIGTGEGAQAFGWGLYFTDKKAIAEGYAKMHDFGTEIFVNGQKYAGSLLRDVLVRYNLDTMFLRNDIEGTKSKLNELLSALTTNKIIFNKEIAEIKEVIDFLGENPSIERVKLPRNLYKVKLHGDRSIDEFNYLRWDKDVTSQQAKRIADKLVEEKPLSNVKDKNVQIKARINEIEARMTGSAVYDYLSNIFGSQKEASSFLLRAGIDGIKYPTEITRKGTHEESFNYVIFDENVAEIEEHIKFQRGQGAKGAIQFLEDGNAIIHALTDPNVSTPLHEVAHLYERYMSKAERDAVLKWAKHKEWTTETSEKFARGFERYLAEGKAPNTALQKVFDRFKEWLTDIYNGITGSEIDLELNDGMRAVYSAMLGEGVVKPKKSTIKETKFEPKTTGFEDIDALLFQVSPEQAKELPYKTKLPTSKEFVSAVENTPDAKITDEGIIIDVVRFQDPKQEGELSVRTGVFYLPASDKNVKHYKGKTGYGGTEKFRGETLIKRPIVVKGATGGKAPEIAYDQIKGKGLYQKMRSDVLGKTSSYGRRVLPEDVAQVLTDYNEGTDYDENYDMAYEIVRVSTKGNTLAYAIQENIVAHAVRDAGYDAVLGYSTRRTDGSNFISEIFDVREITYPSKEVESDIHDKFLESNILFQQDNTEKHTKAVNMLIDKAEAAKEDVVKFVREKLANAGNPVREEIITNVLKQRGYAVKIESEPVGGVREGDRAKAAQGTKERSFGKTLATAGGFFEKLQHDSPMFYVVRRSQEAIEAAAAWLSERTEGQAYQELKKKHVTSISADRQDRREVFLAYLNEQLNTAVADNDMLRAEEVHEMLKTLRVITSEEYTRAGQVVQTAAHWRSVSQDAVRWSVQHEIDKRNEKEVPYTNVTKLKESGEEVNKMSKEAGRDVTKDERVQQVINEVVSKQKGKTKQTNKEKAKVVAQKIRSFKSSNWGITLAAEPISAVGIGVLDGALELTAKTVELSGNVADAIQRGVKHIKQSEWYKDLKEAQKRKIERIFAMNVRKGLGVDKFSKSELEGYLKQEVKDLGQKLNDIIREHWETKNELGVMLSERIIADLGLSEADAKLLEDTVQEIINENIDKNIKEFIDPELVPNKEESRKTFIDKMGKLVMRGDLDTKLFREKFAETFGLTPDLTAQQATDIINLHKAVVETADMGIYGDVVADRFAKEVDKLIPQTKTERLLSGMVALDYANMLFGYTTWFVNIMSAAANIAIRPISETLDFVKWYNSIQTARELKSFPVFLANNPMVDGFRSWIDFAKGVTRISPHSVMDTLLSGGLREMNKYISQVESTAKLRVPELEREVHGRNRFATQLKYKGKTLVDFKYNPFNFMKFSGRFLVAQDVGMFSAFESVELAAKLRKKLLKEGYSEKEISDHINRQVTGAELTEDQKDSVDKQLEQEGKAMAKLGIKIDLFRRNRRRMEIIREQFLELPEEDLLDAEKAAKGQIYTDTRGGVVNSIMSIIGNLSNKNIYTKLLIMPYFPFVKIFANIGDFVLDTVPAYGWLRYRGYSPSTMWAQYLANKEAGMQQPKAITNAVFGKRRPTKELPFLTAQLGDKGTQARERQRQRAMFGNFVMLPAISVIAGLWAFGKDDDDEPWFDVSGARFDVKDQAQRESVPDRMPPWTIKIGNWRFRYQNKPGLMFPMAMLGFYRDMQRADYSDEEIRDRLKLMGNAFMGAFSAMTDLQIAGGFKDLTESLDKLITTAKAYNEDPTAEDIKTQRYLQNFGKYLTRKTITPFTTWLPTKNNLVQQTIQFIADERKESRSIPAILAYNTGIHHWTNNDAIDIFGKTTYSKPGFTQILYKPLLEKRDPQRWEAFEKLFEADAVPAPYWNRMEMVVKNPSERKEGEPMYEYQLPTENEFWTLRQKSGNKFYEDMLRYQNSEAWDIEKEKFSGTLNRSRTVLQDKVARYWNDSKKQTRHYLFTWKEFANDNKKVYEKLYENMAFPDMVTSIDIPAFDSVNGSYMYVDENGQPTILDTVTLGKDEVAELNALAFRDYIEFLDRLDVDDSFAFKVSAQNLWKQVVQLNTQTFIQKYYDNME